MNKVISVGSRPSSSGGANSQISWGVDFYDVGKNCADMPNASCQHPLLKSMDVLKGTKA